MSSTSPIYVVNRLDVITVPKKNKSLLGLFRTEHRESVEKVSFAVNNVTIPLVAFLIIIICATTLVFKLQNKSKWRKRSTSTAQADNMSSRDAKVTKMVLSISGLFIVCFIPVSINFLAMSVDHEFSVDGKYQNINLLTMSVGLLLESVNSATNIFIYYHMSSRFKVTFRHLLGYKDGGQHIASFVAAL